MGILVQGPAPGVAIEDNLVGTNERGTAAIPNQGSGVFIQNSTATISGNQIAGNGYDGITVQGSNAPNGLAGLWSADDTTFDGDSTDGTLLGGATYAPGISGQAFSFDGVSGAFQDSSVYTPPSGRILYPFGATMEMWINTTASSGTLITDGGGIDTQSGMGLFLQNGQLVAIGSDGTAGQFNFQLTSPMTVNDGQWHLVAVTWNGTTAADGVTLYLDGVAVATGTALATIGNLNTENDDGTAQSSISVATPTWPLPYYKGLIDEVGVYRAAISSSDVAAIYSLRGVAQAASATTITGNLIGTDAAGTVALPNGNDGIDLVGSSFNVIGGTTTGDINIVSGNVVNGVELNGAGTTDNVVEGDYIGTNAAGTGAIANGVDGVEIDNDASGDTVGGTTAGAGDVISGNKAYGVELNGSTGNLVEGNFIGTDFTGTVAITDIGSVGVGIDSGASNNTIGGLTTNPGTGAGNVISGNTDDGVLFNVQNTDSGPTDNLVAGNLIGTNGAGTASLGNGTMASSSVPAPRATRSAAPRPPARNIISANPMPAMEIDDANDNSSRAISSAPM